MFCVFLFGTTELVQSNHYFSGFWTNWKQCCLVCKNWNKIFSADSSWRHIYASILTTKGKYLMLYSVKSVNINWTSPSLKVIPKSCTVDHSGLLSNGFHQIFSVTISSSFQCTENWWKWINFLQFSAHCSRFQSGFQCGFQCGQILALML